MGPFKSDYNKWLITLTMDMGLSQHLSERDVIYGRATKRWTDHPIFSFWFGFWSASLHGMATSLESSVKSSIEELLTISRKQISIDSADLKFKKLFCFKIVTIWCYLLSEWKEGMEKVSMIMAQIEPK